MVIIFPYSLLRASTNRVQCDQQASAMFVLLLHCLRCLKFALDAGFWVVESITLYADEGIAAIQLGF